MIISIFMTIFIAILLTSIVIVTAITVSLSIIRVGRGDTQVYLVVALMRTSAK